jgi:mRNA interferase MazF
MADPGDVVTVDFLGATGPKRRPAVVVSSALYHQHRPDLV